MTVVTVSWFSSAMLARLLKNLSQKSKYSNLIQYIIVDNTNGEDHNLNALSTEDGSVRIKTIDSHNLKGSWAHAFGLNYATPQIKTPYTLVVDPDIHVFKEHWDEFLVNELEKNKAIAIGAPYPSWKLGKYHHFPSPPFLLYETSVLKELGLDWTPFSRAPLRRLYFFVCRQITRLGLFCTRQRLSQWPHLNKAAKQLEFIFGVCAPDTGWLIAANAQNKGLKSLLFAEVESRIDPFFQHSHTDALRTLANEFELYQYDNEPILTHKYSTSGYLWKTKHGKDHQYWLDSIQQIENGMTSSLKTNSGAI